MPGLALLIPCRGTSSDWEQRWSNERDADIGFPLSEVSGDQNGLRLGVQEVVRWGMGPSEMPQIAHFLARILLGEERAATLRAEVVAFRAAYQMLRYTLSPEE